MKLLILIFCLSFSVLAQIPAAASEDDSIVKISSDLIQIDVTVTDRDGKIVRNLKPADFEIYENGKPQNLTGFSFISSTSEDNSDPAATDIVSAQEKNIPIPPVKLKAGQVRRSFALVIDDLGLSLSSVSTVQQALKKFINDQIKPGDLVAIIRTGGGIGALQSFTSDKRQMLAAVDKLRWNPQGRGGTTAFTPITKTLKEELQGRVRGSGAVRSVKGLDEEKAFEKQAEDYRQENFASATLEALNHIIRGMKDLPGRKSMVLFSEGFQSFNGENGTKQPSKIFDTMRKLADLANRSSVVIYTLDPRGGQFAGMAYADDDIRKALQDDFDPGKSVDEKAPREEAFKNSQFSLRYLAYETGGLPLVNQNNLNQGLARVIDDQSYYLLGYEPDEETFDPKKNRFNQLVVKVRNPELTVRFRSGFFSMADEKVQKTQLTSREKMLRSLTSPLSVNEIDLTLYPIFTNTAQAGDAVRALVHIDAPDLKFTDGANGKKKANFDLIAVTFGDNGTIVDRFSKNYTVEFDENIYQKVLSKGFVYDLFVPVKKPGAYQFRIVLRDTTADKIGSASQFIEVPNLKDNRLTLSNLLLNSFSPPDWEKIKRGESVSPSGRNLFLDTTQRQFTPGSVLHYGYVIYNASTPSRLQIRTQLIRDGKVILESNLTDLDTRGQADLQRLEGSGAITLGRELSPGNYVLQIMATDPAKAKNQTATQWIDFEIVH